MARALPTLLVLALVGATATAFAHNEGRSPQPAPLYGTAAGRLFSPVCECPADHVPIRFFLRSEDSLTVTIRDARGETVGTLARDRPYPRGWVRLSWDGIQPTGIAVADGVYRPAVHLASEHTTVVLPDEIHVDTAPPRVLGAQPDRLLLSPDGDGRGDALSVKYRLSEPGRGVLLVDGVVRARSARAGTFDSVRLPGTAGGRPLALGPHPLAFSAEDAAGNRSAPQRIGTLTVRYVTLARPLVSVGPGERFYIRVSADAKRVAYTFAGRNAEARPGTFVLRAPRKVGTYRLSVRVGDHVDAARVKVERIG